MMVKRVLNVAVAMSMMMWKIMKALLILGWSEANGAASADMDGVVDLVASWPCRLYR